MLQVGNNMQNIENYTMIWFDFSCDSRPLKDIQKIKMYKNLKAALSENIRNILPIDLKQKMKQNSNNSHQNQLAGDNFPGPHLTETLPLLVSPPFLSIWPPGDRQ